MGDHQFLELFSTGHVLFFVRKASLSPSLSLALTFFLAFQNFFLAVVAQGLYRVLWNLYIYIYI